jgi:hypothetical protein
MQFLNEKKPPPFNPWAGVLYLGSFANPETSFRATLPDGSVVGYYSTLELACEARRVAIAVKDAEYEARREERHKAYLNRHHPEAQGEQTTIPEFNSQNTFAERFEEF